jgi:large subunit ribosomal protein L2
MTYLKHKLKKKLKNLTSKIIILKNYPPIKKLNNSFSWKAGRNNTGHISFNSKSKRIPRNFRLIDLSYSIINVIYITLRIEYDSYRTALVSLICYSNGILSYIIAYDKLKIGDKIFNSTNINLIKKNYGIPLFLSNEGMLIHNIEYQQYKNAILARSAGTFALILKKLNNGFLLLKLPSREQVLISESCFARIGRVSNIDNKFINYYKAGQLRNLGFRSITRGVAKNPIDHPHGGGGGKCQVTPLAKIAKNKKTRNKLKVNLNIIRSRKLAVRKIIIIKFKKLIKAK